tara:strand:+ start:3556 stop:3861 length:306 start_codon:yes stop_codon:yes gene_type:complete
MSSAIFGYGSSSNLLREGNEKIKNIMLRPRNNNLPTYMGGSFIGGSAVGGAIKNPGSDPNHPRLSRDPTWYAGRGRERATNIAKEVWSGIKTIAPIVASVI